MVDLTLVGFNNLAETELKQVNEIMAKRLKKVKFNYKALKLELKQHKHSTYFTHEICVSLFPEQGKPVSSKYSDKNLYKAVDCILEKLINELNHKFKK